MGFWDAEWITAVGGIITGVAGAIALRRKSKSGEPGTPSINQEVVHPETAAEIKSAHALQDIAASLAKIERYFDLFMDRRSRSDHRE